MNKESHKNWFKAYAKKKMAACKRDVMPMALKLEHTLNVAENARIFTAGEKMDNNLSRLIWLAALYHDLGRFDQYLTYGTFKDSESCNHGQLSAKLVREEKRLVDENQRDRSLVLCAIAAHNRFALPSIRDKDFLQACAVVRDADKLDILRIFDEHLAGPKPYNPTIVLSLPDRDDIYSEKAIECALSGKTCAYQDLRTVNDFRLLLGAWFFDMQFATSRAEFISRGHALRVVEAIPDNGIYHAARNKLLAIFKQ